MPIDVNNPNVKIFNENLALVERKERERPVSSGGGIFSSWNTPLDDLDPKLVSQEKREMLLKSQALHPPAPKEVPVKAHAPLEKEAALTEGSRIVVIPLQAMATFKKLMGAFFELEVRLTPEQSKMFLECLQAMPTPKKMFDAKAIFALMEILSK